MANPIILTLRRNHNKKKDAFSWNMKRNGRVVAQHSKYNRKSNMKDTLQATVLVGWSINWKARLGTMTVKGEILELRIVDICKKKAA